MEMQAENSGVCTTQILCGPLFDHREMEGVLLRPGKRFLHKSAQGAVRVILCVVSVNCQNQSVHDIGGRCPSQLLL